MPDGESLGVVPILKNINGGAASLLRMVVGRCDPPIRGGTGNVSSFLRLSEAEEALNLIRSSAVSSKLLKSPPKDPQIIT